MTITLLIGIALIVVGSLLIGWSIGRRAAAPPELFTLIQDVAQLKADVTRLTENDEALRESITVIDEYLQQQQARYANRETDLFGKLSGEIRQHLGVSPREPVEAKDDAPKPTTMGHVL